MNSRKKRFSLFSTTGLLLGSVLFVCASTIAPVLAAQYNVVENTFFLYEDQYGHTYKCYRFKLPGQDGEVPNQVAIAWGEVPGNTPTDLIVPGTVTYDDVTYTVKALTKHAFRYCDFETISLPNSIEQIESEAFAYCTKLTTIGIPYLVDKIYPSTFIDCRSLTSVKYLDSTGKVAFGNTSITEIGDHAFDSCVKLREFYCPSSCQTFGESCFKNCRSLVNFYFPSETKTAGVTDNPITVGSYAFADCKSLFFVYFETNMSQIGNYAFVDCHQDLHIKYNGDAIPSYSVGGVAQTHWHDQYLSDNLTGLVPVDINHPTIYSDPEYPCLRYTTENKTVKLDAAGNKPTKVYVIDQNEVDTEGEYAVIYKFDTPSENVPGCFDPSTGALIIPNTVDGKTVKIIKESAFANNTAIKSITFNKDLVQICNKAFYNCLNIESLDFHLCEKLKEVSYWVFHDENVQICNENVTSLILPDCLEYIGGYAFGEFHMVNELHLPSNVKAIDDLAFFQLGANITEAPAIKVVLPKSLNDKAAEDAYFIHSIRKYDVPKNTYYSHKKYNFRFAVGKYIFAEAKAVIACEMEEDPDHENDNTYTTSFYSNAFNGATNLIRFKASKNLKCFGKDAFKSCSSLREVYLTTTKSQASGMDYPWCMDEDTNNGAYGGTLFFNTLPEVVCYVDGNNAPGILDSYSLASEASGQLNNLWNAESGNSYVNDLRSNSDFSRRVVPTYYNVDFDSVVYWDPTDNSIVNDRPETLAQFDAGVVSFVKNSSNKYIVSRYYYNVTDKTGTDIVDLTQVPNISDATHHDLVEIGNSAFARSDTLTAANNDRDKQPGLYFILPDTITKIDQRAFYRNTSGDQWGSNRYGVRLITYKSGNNYILRNGSAGTYANLTSEINALNTQANYKTGYCHLPLGVTHIGNAAFFNHIFQTITIGPSLTYLGAGAFYSSPYFKNASTIYPRTVNTSIVMDSNSIFKTTSNGGLYYIGGGNDKQILLYQTQANTGNLTLDANTKAVGMGACANTQYTSITLNSGLTTVYGGGFAKNYSVTSIDGVSDLRYIGNMENVLNKNNGWDDADYTEVWDSSMEQHLSITDYRGYGWNPKQYLMNVNGAFAECSNLTTFDFTQLTSVRKIGSLAFSKCRKLINMAGSNTYKYILYNTKNPSGAVVSRTGTDSQNVLDLSNCQNLRSISKNAFCDMDQLKFLHLPDVKDPVKDESGLYISFDPENKTESGSIITNSKGIRVLVGETAEYAYYDEFDGYHNNTAHYPRSNTFGTGNEIYYHCYSVNDVKESSDNIHYWTQASNGDYILLWNESLARTYFANNP